jgi:hypothetical protein
MVLSFILLMSWVTFIDFLYIESSLHPSDKSYLIMVNGSCHIMLIWFVCSSHLALVSEQCWPHKIILDMFPSVFRKSVRRICWEIFGYWLSPLINYWSVQTLCYFTNQTWQVIFASNLFIYSGLSNLLVFFGILVFLWHQLSPISFLILFS